MAQEKPKTIWTPANIVTTSRIVLVPIWLIVAEQVRFGGQLYSGSALAWASLVLYVLISLTDKLDGYLARSRGEVTDFGKFLDPIADKLSVLVAMLYLLEVGLIPSWMVLLVLTREFLVSGLRMVLASEGTVVAASNLGKAKTATTMVALCGLLLYITLPFGGAASGIPVYALVIYYISVACLWAAMALTAWSGIDYLVKGWPAISKVD